MRGFIQDIPVKKHMLGLKVLLYSFTLSFHKSCLLRGAHTVNIFEIYIGATNGLSQT